MKYPFLLAALLTLLLPASALSQTSTASLPPLPAQACVNQIQQNLWQQERIYRQIILGRHPASELPEGSVLYDNDNTAWVKTGGAWVTGTAENLRQKSDDEMDLAREWEGDNDTTASPSTELRRGYFETRGVMTSTLIPYLVESYHALGCRLAMVCEAARQSAAIPATSTTPLIISTPGCAPLTITPFPRCSFANTSLHPADNDSTLLDAFGSAIVRTECQPLAGAILDDEANLLKRAVAYDASYRELLQLSGVLDKGATPIETSVIPLVEKAVDIAIHPEKLACFLTKCHGQ